MSAFFIPKCPDHNVYENWQFNPALGLAQYIHAITEPYHDFLTQFDWRRWVRRVVNTEDLNQLSHLDFGTAIALLYIWYREDRFDETHLKWVVETGRMEVLLANVLRNRTT